MQVNDVSFRCKVKLIFGRFYRYKYGNKKLDGRIYRQLLPKTGVPKKCKRWKTTAIKPAKRAVIKKETRKSKIIIDIQFYDAVIFLV